MFKIGHCNWEEFGDISTPNWIYATEGAMCPVCNTHVEAEPISAGQGPRFNAGLHTSEKPVLYIHPVTGQIEFPMRNDRPIPDRYSRQGFERKEFNSYQEHKKFCKDNGLVNQKAEDTPKHKDLQKSKWGY